MKIVDITLKRDYPNYDYAWEEKERKEGRGDTRRTHLILTNLRDTRDPLSQFFPSSRPIKTKVIRKHPLYILDKNLTFKTIFKTKDNRRYGIPLNRIRRKYIPTHNKFSDKTLTFHKPFLRQFLQQ